MTLDATTLAQKLWETLEVIPLFEGEVGYPGLRLPSQEIKDYAEGYIACLKAGVCNIASNSVIGTGIPNGGNVTGSATGGLLTLVDSIMTTIAVSHFTDPTAIAKLTLENQVVIAYIKTGLVNFSSQIIGTDSAIVPGPPPVTGYLVSGVLKGGKITGLDGTTLAGLVEPLGPKQEDFYKTLVNYTIDNLESEFAENSVTGTFVAPPGITMTLGTAIGGTIK